ncbi:hypothetical protein BU26DRAFT_239000 [Trematosphaeria pertusa]|uniref:Uncharacterized protein n=1 Tax=Trematosphaeria pertusa TaxID=390896 RepID=A0A6A6HR52_9PLEO|nr:uncharacterized protein BU26DRAFT_239000 [Trematosphaeria pertusa]KAF2240278.1 hypothetical protein BU26DRAFT_239000 [Trematosphaeria pertusa]
MTPTYTSRPIVMAASMASFLRTRQASLGDLQAKTLCWLAYALLKRHYRPLSSTRAHLGFNRAGLTTWRLNNTRFSSLTCLQDGRITSSGLPGSNRCSTAIRKRKQDADGDF